MRKNKIKKNIPQDWKVIPAGDVFAFVKSYAFSRENLVNDSMNDDGIGNIHYGDIHSTFLTSSIDLTKVSIPKIKDKSFSPKQGDLLKDGDLIMADASEDYEGVGITVSLHGLKGKKVVGGLHTFVLRDTKNITDPYFRQYIFLNPEIRNTLQKIASGVSVYSLSKTAVSKVLLPLPPLPEQKRIVAVLETWDGTLSHLKNKLILKVRLKRSLMQRLLTGKSRIYGFSKKWTTVRLSDALTVKHGKSQKEIEISSGKYPILGTGGIIGKTDSYLCNTSSVLIGRKGTIDKPVFMDTPFWTVDTLFYCPIKENYDARFLFYKFQMIPWKKYNEGSGVPSLAASTIASIKIETPELEEQSSISNILRIADKEINLLKCKLKILEKQKKYLLNHLMTGSIRVPDEIPKP